MLPFQHPLRIAEDAALIDELSHGRFSLAVGRGWQLPEFEAFQIDQTASRGMFAEAMEIIQKAWIEDQFSFEGDHWSFKDVSVFPKPVQKPLPPHLPNGGHAGPVRARWQSVPSNYSITEFRFDRHS